MPTTHTPHPPTPPDSWRRLEELFTQALQQSHGSRDAFLEQSCPDDPALLTQLKTLLSAHDRANQLLDAPAIGFLSTGAKEPVVTSTLIGRRIGQYQISRAIASGGMGTVYEAMQDHPRRTVALKVMHGGTIERSALRRFESEAEILGRLHHPAIAQIYESGVFESDEGPQPYFAMEFIDGRPITEFVRSHHLDVRARLRLLIQVCHGVQHAHSSGVIHRDLKPANILVTQGTGHEASGTSAQCPMPNAFPKILDFGIARVIAPAAGDTQSTLLRTGAGTLMGTIPYMSPEQIAGDPAQIDHQSDVYALGVIGYELLADRLPHDLKDSTSRGAGGILESLRIVREQEPLPLSRFIKMSASDRLGAMQQRELSTIIGKAMEKDKARRYAGVAELASDFERFLNDEPVLARPPSTMYQLRKFARRNRILVGGIAAAFVILILGIITTAWQWARATEQRNQANAASSAAIAAQEQANTRLEQTLQMSAEMMELAEHQLANVIGGTRARESLALAALRGFSHSHAAARASFGGWSGAYGLAYAHQRVGEVRLTMGQSAAALASHQHALALREQLLATQPQNVSFLRALAVGHWNVGQVLAVQGRFEDAMHHQRQSLEIHQQIDRISPQTYSQHYLGANHRRIAEVHAMMGEHAAALENHRRSVEYFESMIAADPHNTPSQQGLAMTFQGLGRSLLAVGDEEAALIALSESMHIIDQQAAHSVSRGLWITTNRAKTLNVMSSTHLRLRETETGLHEAVEANAIAERLANADPLNYESRQLLAETTATLAETQHRHGETEQAVKTRRSAIDQFEALIIADPGNVLVRSALQHLHRE